MMTNTDIKRFKELYSRKEHYGRNSVKFYEQISKIIEINNYYNILDYGCGNSELYSLLENNLGVKVYRYDPSISGLEYLPNIQFDFVICSDVLHCIGEDKLDETLSEISSPSNNCFIYLNCIDHPTTFFWRC